MKGFKMRNNIDELYDKFEEIIFSGNRLSYPVIGKEKNIKNSILFFFDHDGSDRRHRRRWNNVRQIAK